MSDDDARKLGQALADYLPDAGMVLVATDVTKPDSSALAFVEGLRLQGRDVIVQHDLSYEDVARAVPQFEVAGGAHISVGSVVMIAADGSKLPVDTVMAIMEAAENDNFVPAMEQGSIRHEPPSKS